MVFVLGDVPGKTGLAANTVPRDAACNVAQERPAYCEIQVTNRGQGLTGFAFTHVVAHELFHCFQYDFATSAKQAANVPAWLAEGAAAWVGEVISFGSTIGEEYWESWLKEPGTPLFQRTYDGIGFFMHLMESGIDPWPLLVAMHRKGESSSVDAYGVAVKGKAAGRMIDAWGASYLRDGSLQPDWSMSGPGLPEFVKSPVAEGTLANGDSLVAGLDPLAAMVARIAVGADAFVIVGRPARGLVRFADESAVPLAELLGQPVCTLPGGCACPTGSPGSRHTWRSAPKGDVLLGLSGHTDGVELAIDGYSVEVACAQAPEDFQTPEPCWCPPGPLGRLDAEPATLVTTILARG